MRRKTDDRPLLPRHGMAARLHQPPKPIEIIDEAPLSGVGRATAKSRMRVKYRQQRQADAGNCSGPDDPLDQFARIAIGHAGDIVVDVVKLPDPGKSGLQHLDIGLRGHGLDIVGRHAADEAVHQFPPRPEAVHRRASDLGETGHAALKGMTVQIANARKPDPVTLIA